MKAAVVHSFDAPPQFGEFDAPIAGTNEVRVNVRAAALSQLVRAQASGKHYSAAAGLPIVPGFDGAGSLEDGRRVFFAFPRAPFGTMGEQTVIPHDLLVDIPDDVDDVTAAAVGNPGMSSWAALKERAKLASGESVLINGATGVSGRLAIQIARHFGARRIVVTGRTTASERALLSLGADRYIPLDQSTAALVQSVQEEILSGGVRVVLDYLWGAPAESLVSAIAGVGSRIPGENVRFVQIGAMAGATISMPGAALRSSGLEMMGTGLGSLSNQRVIQTIGEVLRAFHSAKMTIDTEAVSLADVSTAWHRRTPKRLVFTI